jgi:RHS repeat-associated protein
VGKTTSTNTIKFTGQYRDTDTAANLDYFGARYYSNTVGRFMSPDWAAKPTTVPYAKFGDPQSLNLYSYTENGPINRIDADGHSSGAIMTAQGGGRGGDSLDGGHNQFVDEEISAVKAWNAWISASDGTTGLSSTGLESTASANAPAEANSTGANQFSAQQLPLPFGPRPAACQGVSADDLEYDTPTPWRRQDGTHDTGGEHIYKYHIDGDPLTKSQYTAEYPVPVPKSLMLPQVVGRNAQTFMMGNAVQKKPGGNIVFTYRFPQYPYVAPPRQPIGGIGRLPGGALTWFNTLVLGSDCKFVITSHAGLPGFGGVP